MSGGFGKMSLDFETISVSSGKTFAKEKAVAKSCSGASEFKTVE